MGTALETESADTEIAHDVWQREDDARSPEYLRWVQRTLNEVMGLRLPLNGVDGLATRSAVRGFQTRSGLPVSGIVGTDTEDALKAARRRYGLIRAKALPRRGSPRFSTETIEGWHGPGRDV